MYDFIYWNIDFIDYPEVCSKNFDDFIEYSKIVCTRIINFVLKLIIEQNYSEQ